MENIRNTMRKKGKKAASKAAKKQAGKSAKWSAAKQSRKAKPTPSLRSGRQPETRSGRQPETRSGRQSETRSGRQPETRSGRPNKTPSPPLTRRKTAFNAKTDSAYDPTWVAPGWNDDVLLGAHVSIAGGTTQAPLRARATGSTAIQIFTKMANRWAERACEDHESMDFRAGLAESRVRETMAHDSYLINLAIPVPPLRRHTIESFVAELRRCEALGLTYLVSHPGNFVDDRASGVHRNADALTAALH